MAADFYQQYQPVRDLFEIAAHYLTFAVQALCFEEIPQLHQTAFTQPCIMTAEMAMYASLKAEIILDCPFREFSPTAPSRFNPLGKTHREGTTDTSQPVTTCLKSGDEYIARVQA